MRFCLQNLAAQKDLLERRQSTAPGSACSFEVSAGRQPARGRDTGEKSESLKNQVKDPAWDSFLVQSELHTSYWGTPRHSSSAQSVIDINTSFLLWMLPVGDTQH